MTLVKFNRNRNFPTLNQDWDKFMESCFSPEFTRSHYIPSVNVTENENAYKLELAAPGRNKEDFKISMENDLLTIRYQKEQKKEESTEKFTRKEFHLSTFDRSFHLPESVNAEKIEAVYKDGILTISLPKNEEEKKNTQKVIKIS